MGTHQTRNAGDDACRRRNLVKAGADVHRHDQIGGQGAGRLERQHGAQAPVGITATVELERRKV